MLNFNENALNVKSLSNCQHVCQTHAVTTGVLKLILARQHVYSFFFFFFKLLSTALVFSSGITEDRAVLVSWRPGQLWALLDLSDSAITRKMLSSDFSLFSFRFRSMLHKEVIWRALSSMSSAILQQWNRRWKQMSLSNCYRHWEINRRALKGSF